MQQINSKQNPNTMNTSTIVSDICRVPTEWLAKVLNIPYDVADYILVGMCGYTRRNGVCIPRLLMPPISIPLQQPSFNALGDCVILQMAFHSFRRRMIDKYYIIAYMENAETDDTQHSCGSFYIDEEEDYVIDEDMYIVDTETNELVQFSPYVTYSVHNKYPDERNFQTFGWPDRGSSFSEAYKDWREEWNNRIEFVNKG
jgi:hypothetical protein